MVGKLPMMTGMGLLLPRKTTARKSFRRGRGSTKPANGFFSGGLLGGGKKCLYILVPVHPGAIILADCKIDNEAGLLPERPGFISTQINNFWKEDLSYFRHGDGLW